MSQYAIDSTSTPNDSHNLLIGIPLAITLVFCFGFVAMQPHKDNDTVSASKNGSEKSPAKQLPPVPVAAASVQTLSTVDTSSPTTSSAAATTAAVPQTTKAVGTPNTTTPQSAAPSAAKPQTVAEYKKHHQTINVNISNTVNRLLR